VTMNDCTFTGNIALCWGGGGMTNVVTELTLDNCLFSDNKALLEQFGGGAMRNSGCSLDMTDCTFSGNQAQQPGGAIENCFEGRQTFVFGCTFSDNQATVGGGIFNIGCEPVIEDCQFTSNRAYGTVGLVEGMAIGGGGALCNMEGSRATLVGCVFSSNSATSDSDGGGGSGGAILNGNSSGVDAVNCGFAGNSASGSSGDNGGGAVASDFHSYANATNCTFTGNSAVSKGGALLGSSGSLSLVNCILWGDSASMGSEIALENNCSLSIRYCGVQGGQAAISPNGTINWGNGVSTEDPQFEDGAGRLSWGSPCIDAGDNAAVGASEDLDGNPRIVDGDQDGTAIVDMGAYEF